MARSGRESVVVGWMGRLAILMAALCGLVGCAGGSAPEKKVASTGNAELDRLLAVEASADSRTENPLPESLDYRGSLPFAYQHTTEDDIERFDMVVGDAGNVLTCYVYRKEVELGATAARLAAVGGSVLEQKVAPFPDRRIAQLYTGVEAGRVHHGITWLWGDPKGYAQPKAIAGNGEGFGAACLHLGLGYQQTMIDVLTHLLASLEPSEPAPAPHFEEVVLSQVDGMDVGVTRLRMYRGERGDTKVRIDESVLVPTSPQSVSVTYGLKLSSARPDGDLIEARVFEADLEESRTDLQLRPEDGGWRIVGTYHGKALDQVLEHRGAISSARAEYLWLGERLRPHGEETKATLVGWMPDLDPARVMTTTLAVDPGRPEKVEMVVGPLTMDGERGDEGYIDRGTLPFGGRSMSMRVAYRSGRP